MHDVDNRGFRFTLAASGMAASLIFLLASMFANYRYGASLARSTFDGHIYGAAAAACDVLMAAAPFFFFAGLKNRSFTQMFAATIVWAVMTAVAAVSAISQTSVNRIDAISARITKSTAYADARSELEQARRERGFIPQHRPEATVQAEMEKHKVSRLWSSTNECSDPSGESQRKYCSQYAVLKAEMGYAQQATKLEARIETLMGRSEKAVESGGAAVGSEADPGAKTLSLISGYELRTVQSLIVGLIAVMFLVGAGLGPYTSWAIMETARPRDREQAPPMIDGHATDITPLPEPVTLEEAKPLAIAAPPKPKGGKIEPQPPADPGPEWAALLTALGFPAEGWQPPRDSRGDFILREKDHPQVAAWRFFVFAQATQFLGEFTPEQIDEAVERFAKLDFRIPTGSRVVKPELEGIRRWVKKESPPVRWIIKPAPIDAVRQMLVNRKILTEALPEPATDATVQSLPASPAAEPAEEAKPNGIKALALRRFFKGSDAEESGDGTLLN